MVNTFYASSCSKKVDDLDSIFAHLGSFILRTNVLGLPILSFTSFSCCVWFISLCIIALVNLLYNYFTANYIFHDYNTRSKNNLHISCIKSDYGKKPVRFKVNQLWNKLRDSLKGIVPIAMYVQG